MPAGRNARWPHQGARARACPATVELSRSAFLVWLLLVPAVPLHAANSFTTNDSDGEGVSGVLFAAPPGSCTSFPGTAGGNCETRGAAALADWADGFYNGSRWSDLREAAIPGGAISTITGLSTPTINTNIGKSWIPDSCNRPWCGNLLRGDVEPFDLTGDGQEDRIFADQFAWGVTSLNRDLADLSLVVGNVSPPGITRMRVRIALGDASETPSGECDGDMANPACTNGVITDPLTRPDRDPSVWGRCDPDRFTGLGDPVRAQRALDNCLWLVASTPLTSPESTSPDPLLDEHAVRETWINQIVTKYVAAVTPDQQDFTQSWTVTYGFDKNLPLDSAIYQNDWRLAQVDVDPNPTVPSTVLDTYNYELLIQHTAQARRRGYNQELVGSVLTQNPLTAECLATGANCDGLTNPTVDPFWGKALMRDGGGNVVLDAGGFPLLDPNKLAEVFEFLDTQPCGEECLESGVGREQEFSFLFTQVVEGLLLSCLNCDHPAPKPFGDVSYEFIWPSNFTITDFAHPPASSTTVSILNASP
jgi:hypothetical protein